MPPDLKRLLRDLADLYEREEEGESSQALHARIEALEARAEEAPKAELADALGELTDDERELIREYRESATTPPKPKQEKPVEEGPEAKPSRTRPGRKSGALYEFTVDDAGNVQRVDIPTVYSGPDEPDEVELPDDEEDVA